MATQSRRQLPTLKEDLLKSPYKFEFHQAVKIIEGFYKEETPLGEGVLPEKEALSIKSKVYLSAPPSDIYSLDFASNDNHGRVEVHINFMGVAGLQGPLPMPYTELILDRLKQNDKSFKDFLDIFNHRLASLLHRIRKKYWVGLDNRHAYETPLGQSLLSFTGMKSSFLQSQQVPPQDLLYYAGLYWQRPRSGAGLKQILTHYFDVPVAIESNQGEWIPISSDQWTRLGEQNNTLGQTAMVGRKFWSVEENLRILIGPMPRQKFDSFLKIGSFYKKALEIASFYLPEGYKYTIQLIIAGTDVTPTQLDGKARLGWTSWLVKGPKTTDDDQVILYPF